MADPNTAPATPTVDFDVGGAMKAGYSEKEIADHLAGQTGFDLSGARKAGYNDVEIIRHLAAPAEAPAKPEPVAEMPPSGTGLGIARAAGQSALESAAGIKSGIGALVKTAGQSEGRQSTVDVGLMERLDQGEDVRTLMKSAPNDLARLALREYQIASPEQKAKIRQGAMNAAAAPPGAVERAGTNIMGAGRDLAVTAKEAFPLTPEEESRPTVMGTKMLVGLAGYIGAGATAGLPGVMGYGGVQAYGSTYEEAKKAGARDDVAAGAALLNGVTQGAAMAVPVGESMKLFQMVPVALRGKVMTAIAEAAKSGAVLLGFSQASKIADNVVAQNTFDPTRPTLQGVGDPKEMAVTATVGALLPTAGAVVRKAFPNPEATVQKVVDAPTLDDAITNARAVVDANPVDINDVAAKAREFGGEGEQQQAQLLQLFGGLNRGTVEQAADGAYHYRTGEGEAEQTVPLKVWDERAPQPVRAEGEPASTTISPQLAAAQRAHYDRMGVRVVYFDGDARIPFDGAVDPQNPNTIFLSNNPERNAAQVGAHEITHVLESTTLPDGTNLGDLLHQQIAQGLTPEGLRHAYETFGRTAPERATFPEGGQGDAAHVDAVFTHLIREMGADIGGEAPRFQTFVPKVVDAIQQRYGAQAAKDVLAKFIAGIQQAMRTLREFFAKREEHAEFGQPDTVSQNWVSNLEQVHDTLAKMYAERFGEQLPTPSAALSSPVPAVRRPIAVTADAVPPPEPTLPGGIAFSPRREEPFYSALTRGVEGLRLEKATPGQWEATIRNMPGVKAEERAWVGVEDWLRKQTRSVNKAEVLDYLREHEVKLEEVTKGGRPVSPFHVTALAEFLEQAEGFSYGDARELAERAGHRDSGAIAEIEALGKGPQDLLDPFYEESPTKFEGYKLPGGENYREMLMTLPAERHWLNGSRVTAEDLATQHGREAADRSASYVDDVFLGSHWDEPNVLAHVRFDDRTGPNGERVLHLAEVQSDWHQTGRKQGYQAPDLPQLEARRRELEAIGRDATPEQKQEWAEIMNKIRPDDSDIEGGSKFKGVPDAPFKTSWPELAMRRMLRYAAEHGYDRLTWDTGATNVDRYDLRKRISEITYNGDNRLIAYGHGSMATLINEIVPPEKLPDVIGKEAAERLLAQKPQRGPGDIDDATRHMRGVDLAVGGEGMHAFYDKQLPLIANKIGKKFGAKVEDGAVSAGPDEDRAREAMRSGDSAAIADAVGDRLISVHSIDITPAMRESVMQGQPLFSPRTTGENKNRAYTPEQKKAFDEMGATTESPTLRDWFNKKTEDAGKRAIISGLDRYYGIKADDPSGYMGMRLANSAAGATEVFRTEGTLKFDGATYDWRERNGGVMALVKGLGPEAHDFMRWVAGNRAGKLKAEGRENLLDDDAIKALKSLNQGQLTEPYTLASGKTTMSREAAYLDSLKKYHTLNQNVMDLTVESGLLTRKAADDLLKDPFYVPFYRVDPLEGEQFVAPGSSTAAVKKSAFKKLKGGTEKLNDDLWENADSNWAHLIEASLKNKNVVPVLETAAQQGAAVKLTPQEALHLSDKVQKSTTVWAMVNGEKQYYRVEDPGLFAAVSVLEPVSNLGGLMPLARGFKNLLSTGVTMSPLFAIRNVIRDTQQVLATTPISWNVAKNLYTGFKENNAGQAMANFGRAVAGRELQEAGMSDTALSALAGGALMRFGDVTDTGVRQTTIGRMLNTPEAVQSFWSYLKTAGEAYRKTMAQSEDVSRIALFKQLKDQGLPQDYAAFSAKDIADFTLTGAAPLVRTIIAMSAFTNPRMQGLYKVGRSAADADKSIPLAVGTKLGIGMAVRVAKVAAAGALLGIALDAVYADDEDNKKRTEFDKNSNYWFKVGTTEFRIPMGFEVGALSRLGAIFAESFYDKEMTPMRALRNLGSILLDNLSLNPLPTAVKPALDIATNTRSTGGPVVPMGMDRLLPDQRYTTNNTLAARGASTLLNNGTMGVVDPSPIQLDYLVRAYGGWLAASSLQVGDTVARSFTSEPVRPAADTLANLTGGIVSSEPRSESRYVNMLYEQGKGIEQAYATYRDLTQRGDADAAQRFFEKNQEALQKHGTVSAVMRLESDINRQIRLVTNNPDPRVTAEQKHVQIMQLQAMKNRAAEQVFGARP